MKKITKFIKIVYAGLREQSLIAQISFGIITFFCLILNPMMMINGFFSVWMIVTTFGFVMLLKSYHKDGKRLDKK